MIKRFKAENFAGLATWLRQMQLVYLNPASAPSLGPAQGPLEEDSLNYVREQIERGKQLAASMGCNGTIRVADRLLVAIGDPPNPNRHMISNYASDISHLLGEMSERLQEDLECHFFLQLSADGASKYEKAAEIFGSGSV